MISHPPSHGENESTMKHAIACLIGLWCCSSTASAKPPNILIFLADDLGWADLGFQGSPDIRTPTHRSTRCTEYSIY